MEKLFVYADFDWLNTFELIGELSFDSVRGNETYGFSFSPAWLSSHGDIFLGEDLNVFTGWQYTPPGKEIFSCFADALPDRWGRTLINRKEQIVALEKNRPVRHLSSFDYLMAIDDFSRMGAFRFSTTEGGEFINTEDYLRIPPLADIRQLMAAANEIEKSESANSLPALKWVDQLVHPGTSLGGARPKASVLDETGHLSIAKFPSRNDDYDVGLWEHFCHVMGRKAGLKVAETRVLEGSRHHILLSRRFDRNAVGKRIHFASGLTMTGLSDGDNASSGHGYPDLVDFIVSHCSNVEENLEELYRRVAFYIIMGNSDDHFRNHGFLLTRKGWELSPAYDINPTLSDYQSLLINSETSKADLNTLLSSSKEYMIGPARGREIIGEVKAAMEGWEKHAVSLGLSKRDINTFADRINSRLRS